MDDDADADGRQWTVELDDLDTESRQPVTPGRVNPEHATFVVFGIIVTLYTLGQLVV